MAEQERPTVYAEVTFDFKDGTQQVFKSCMCTANGPLFQVGEGAGHGDLILIPFELVKQVRCSPTQLHVVPDPAPATG